MNIAAFIISLFSAMVSFFQGGCGTMLASGGHGLAQHFGDTRRAGELAALGGSGLLVMLAAVVGVVGGSLSLAKKKASYICLGVSTGLCGLSFLGGFTDAVIWGILYGVAAGCAYAGNNGGAATSGGALSQDSNSTAQPSPIAQNSSAALKEAAPRKQKVYEPVLGVETEALIKQAGLVLEDGDFNEAGRYFAQAINQDPENYRAYLGRLLAELRIKTAGELVDTDEPLEENKLFQRALRFASENEKARLEEYARVNRKKLELRETERIAEVEDKYIKALAMKKQAKDWGDFQDLKVILLSIMPYKDTQAIFEEVQSKMERMILGGID